MDKEVSLSNFEDFKEDWLIKHPASIPIEEVEDSPYPRWLKSATLLMFLAAALLSAVHTIPVIYATMPDDSIVSLEIRTAAANASIAAFELGILLSAFLMIVKSSEWLAWLLLGVMFIGTVVANIVSISQASDGTLGAGIVTLIFGAGVPIIALAAGKLFVNIHNTERALKKRAKDEYREALKQLDTTINQAYSKYVRDGQKAVSERPSAPVRTDGHVQSGFGYGRTSDAKELVRKHLADNPEDIDAAVRDLAGRLGVGKTTVSDVQREMRNRTNSNGNGHYPE